MRNYQHQQHKNRPKTIVVTDGKGTRKQQNKLVQKTDSQSVGRSAVLSVTSSRKNCPISEAKAEKMKTKG